MVEDPRRSKDRVRQRDPIQTNRAFGHDSRAYPHPYRAANIWIGAAPKACPQRVLASAYACSMSDLRLRPTGLPIRDPSRGQPDRRPHSVGLVITGGTIGAHEDDSVLAVQASTAHATKELDLLTQAWHQPVTFDVHVRCPLRLLSENLEPGDWIPIAEAVRDLVETEDVSGVVVFHGTDTMVYTAAALSFLLSDIDKPVVLTGSNLPSDQEGSDAPRNVHDSLIALEALEAGTYIVFAGANDLPGVVHLGTRARKLQASGQAFASINRLPVGEVVGDTFNSLQLPARRVSQSFKCAIDPHVLALRLYPGLDFAAAYSAVTYGHIRGVVIELYASATGPHTDDRYSLPVFIRRCVERGVTVATTVPAAPEGPSNVYETTLAIAEAGGVFLLDMLPETATAKLMWALAQRDDMRSVQELMLTPIAGEIGDGRRSEAP